MTSKTILVVTCVSLAVLIGCGDDDTPDLDAGPDASDDASVTDSGNESGSGGRGGRGGNGGSGGAAGSAGAGAGGSGGSGGAAGGGVSMHTVGGSVTGLAGNGLKLKNNDGDELTVSGSTFEFSTPIASGVAYAVTVSAQPSNPTQACTVANGTGEVGSEDVDDVVVTCVTSKYSIKGTIATYTGSGLVLKNNGGDAITITSAATTFEFPTKLDSGANYAVTVATQPSTQPCAVSMGSGQVGSSDVTSVSVDCHDKNVLQIEPSFGSAIARWNNTGAESYTLRVTTDANCDLTMPGCAGPAEITTGTMPYTVPGLMNGTLYYFQLVANYPGGVKSVSNKTATRPSAPRYNGEVRALATAASGKTYAGGTFTRLSVHTGAAVPVHKTTGFPSEMPNFPIIDADVYAVAPDNTGGYYIGGAAGLAHIKSDGTIDTAWNAPAITGGTVHTIAVHNTTVYFAGDFTNVGADLRSGLAAVSTVNGNLVMGWNPNPTVPPPVPPMDPVPPVSTLAFLGDDVLVGGAFTNIATVAQQYLALVDGVTGALESWTPAPDATVNAIATNGNTIYVGGDFRNIGGQLRDRLAVFDGAVAAPTSWNPGANTGAVTQLSFASNTVYIAGGFTSVGAAPDNARAGLAAIDATTGTLKEWNPMIMPAGSVVNLAASADTVYLAGSFTSVGGMARSATAAVSGSGPGAVTPWNPNPDDITSGFAVVGDSVVMVGQFRGLGGLARQHLVAYGSSNVNDVTNWNPGADRNVHALATSGTTVYVGGELTELGGQTRNHVGAVDENGTLADWNPNADSDVFALAVDGSTVYIGGAFSNLGGRAGIAAVGAANGLPTGWNVSAGGGTVRALAVSGGTLYAGGDFTTFGGISRSHLAAATTAGTGTVVTTWDPNVTSGTVRALAVGASTVIAGGDFTSIGPPPTPTLRAHLASINISDGSVETAFAPDPDGVVRALMLVGTALYVGGDYENFGVLPATQLPYLHMAILNAQGVPQPAKYDYDGSVFALSVGASNVYVGGDFTNLNSNYVSGFSVLPK